MRADAVSLDKGLARGGTMAVWTEAEDLAELVLWLAEAGRPVG